MHSWKSRSNTRRTERSLSSLPSSANRDVYQVEVCNAINGDAYAKVSLSRGAKLADLKFQVRLAASTPRHMSLRFIGPNGEEISDAAPLPEGELRVMLANRQLFCGYRPKCGQWKDRYLKLATTGQAWKVEEYSHLYQADPSDPDCITFLPTGKRIHRTEQSQNSHHGHSLSGAYQSLAKVHFFASDLFGLFHLDRVPKNPAVVPSMSTIREAYGDRLPAYDTVGKCLPLSVHLKSGKKGTATQDFAAHRVFGMGVCYWDGSGGPGYFRDGTKVQGNLVANWTVCRDGSDQSVYIETVYEDPYFSSTTKVTTQKYERLIDPADEQKRPDPRGQKEQEHKYNSHLAAEGQFCTVTDGRWWPIWLLCRTKKGWWTICWYQLLECGDWTLAVWWYDDRHVHLLDVIR